jgi:hypothetical protein
MRACVRPSLCNIHNAGHVHAHCQTTFSVRLANEQSPKLGTCAGAYCVYGTASVDKRCSGKVLLQLECRFARSRDIGRNAPWMAAYHWHLEQHLQSAVLRPSRRTGAHGVSGTGLLWLYGLSPGLTSGRRDRHGPTRGRRSDRGCRSWTERSNSAFLPSGAKEGVRPSHRRGWVLGKVSSPFNMRQGLLESMTQRQHRSTIGQM